MAYCSLSRQNDARAIPWGDGFVFNSLRRSVVMFGNVKHRRGATFDNYVFDLELLRGVTVWPTPRCAPCEPRTAAMIRGLRRKKKRAWGYIPAQTDVVNFVKALGAVHRKMVVRCVEAAGRTTRDIAAGIAHADHFILFKSALIDLSISRVV